MRMRHPIHKLGMRNAVDETAVYPIAARRTPLVFRHGSIHCSFDIEWHQRGLLHAAVRCNVVSTQTHVNNDSRHNPLDIGRKSSGLGEEEKDSGEVANDLDFVNTIHYYFLLLRRENVFPCTLVTNCRQPTSKKSSSPRTRTVWHIYQSSTHGTCFPRVSLGWFIQCQTLYTSDQRATYACENTCDPTKVKSLSVLS